MTCGVTCSLTLSSVLCIGGEQHVGGGIPPGLSKSQLVGVTMHSFSSILLVAVFFFASCICMLSFPVCYHSLYVTIRCMLPFAVCYHSLYVVVPYFFHSLYVVIPCMFPFPVCCHSLYVVIPCILLFPACFHSMYVVIPCFLLSFPVLCSAMNRMTCSSVYSFVR